MKLQLAKYLFCPNIARVVTQGGVPAAAAVAVPLTLAVIPSFQSFFVDPTTGAVVSSSGAGAALSGASSLTTSQVGLMRFGVWGWDMVFVSGSDCFCCGFNKCISCDQ